jgi:hypothetical protein
MTVRFRKRTDKETLRWLLPSGSLTPVETVDIQRSYNAVVAGHELEPHQRMKANTLYNTYSLGQGRVQPGRRHGQAKTEELLATFDALPRPKKPPGNSG